MRREREIGFVIRRLNNAIMRDVEKSKDELQVEQIKGINGWVISYFYENRDKDIFQRDFEEKFSIRGSTASCMLKTMEQKGFIERQSVANDARLKKIVLTEKAIKQHNIIMNDIIKREKKLKNGIDEEELDVFFKVMNKLTANMEEEND